MQTYSYAQTVFTGYVCILGLKPQEPVGPNKRREPKTCGTLHLSADAAVCSFFANADEPAPDAVKWDVYGVPGITAPLVAYLGDKTPVYPDGCVTTTTIKELRSPEPLDRKKWLAGCTPATCSGPVTEIERAPHVRTVLTEAVDYLQGYGASTTAEAIIAWLTGPTDAVSRGLEDTLHRAARYLDDNRHAITADAVRSLLGQARLGACAHAVAEAVSC
jgi:hypothetical protein